MVCAFLYLIQIRYPSRFPTWDHSDLKELQMAKRQNYGYEKRQKEIAKKAKKEEKRKRKLEGDEQGDLEVQGEAEQSDSEEETS